MCASWKVSANAAKYGNKLGKKCISTQRKSRSLSWRANLARFTATIVICVTHNASHIRCVRTLLLKHLAIDNETRHSKSIMQRRTMGKHSEAFTEIFIYIPIPIGCVMEDTKAAKCASKIDNKMLYMIGTIIPATHSLHASQVRRTFHLHQMFRLPIGPCTLCWSCVRRCGVNAWNVCWQNNG